MSTSQILAKSCSLLESQLVHSVCKGEGHVAAVRAGVSSDSGGLQSQIRSLNQSRGRRIQQEQRAAFKHIQVWATQRECGTWMKPADKVTVPEPGGHWRSFYSCHFIWFCFHAELILLLQQMQQLFFLNVFNLRSRFYALISPLGESKFIDLWIYLIMASSFFQQKFGV